MHDAESPKEGSTTEQGTNGKGPIWSYQSGRVTASVFKHHQNAGPRYTTAICRSYFATDEGRWKRTHFYDRQDMPDVAKCVAKADAYLNSVLGPAEDA